ncbi:hypothetical protein FRC02_001544 [Tulasnella sp. 418]|nr:hypothetical protein FRC02_001544 [Tulasnella sp. 418]
MTNKKAHEVDQMCSLISDMLQPGGSSVTVKHIVDIGAGQGYLSRALSIPPVNAEVLALDSNDLQTTGAEYWNDRFKEVQETQAKKKKKKMLVQDATAESMGDSPAPLIGSIAHENIFVDKDTLPAAIGKWIASQRAADVTDSGDVPILLTGLHACGSLTTAVLNSFLALQRDQETSSPSQKGWICSGMAIVGCCYNRMNSEEDFPLSKFIKTQPPLRLEVQHKHLAAQSTPTWSNDWTTHRLARKKCVYRALLERELVNRGFEPTFRSGRQVGRLNDKSFESWEKYFSLAIKRMGFDIQSETIPPPIIQDEETIRLMRRLELLHVLRCLLGPVVESLILMDRWLYLREELPEQVKVQMVNVFNQNTGSARNVALVVQL